MIYVDSAISIQDGGKTMTGNEAGLLIMHQIKRSGNDHMWSVSVTCRPCEKGLVCAVQ